MAKSGQTAPNILCTDLATFSQLDRSDAVCQLFESHWLIDETPEISRYLVLVPESERSRLFSRLVQIEVQYRKARGESIVPGVFTEMYPHDCADLREQLQKSQDSDDTTGLSHQSAVATDTAQTATRFRKSAGSSLASLLKEKRFKWLEAVVLIADIADTLEREHQIGTFHPGLTPERIWLEARGTSWNVDLRLTLEGHGQLDKTSATLDEFAYIPPEVIHGREGFADIRTDIYCLGSILYQLLTDRLLFVAKSPEDWRNQIRERLPRAPRTIDDGIPLQVERVCLKCLDKNAQDRFQTARELAGELRSLAESCTNLDVDPLRSKTNAAETSRGFRLRWRWFIAALICFVSIGGGISSFITRRSAEYEATTSSIKSDPAAQKLVNSPPDFPLQTGSESSGTDDIDEISNIGRFPQTSSLGIVTKPVDQWIDGLTKPPKFLMSLAPDKDIVIRYRRKSNEVYLSAADLVLLEVGETFELDYDLQVTLYQNGWEGEIGIFLGYQEAPDFGPNRRNIQFVYLERNRQKGRLPISVKLSSVSINDFGQFSGSAQYLGDETPFPTADQKLTIEIRQRQLHGIQWGAARGALQPGLKVSKYRGPTSFVGRFGLYLKNSTGTFRDFRVRVLAADRK